MLQRVMLHSLLHRFNRKSQHAQQQRQHSTVRTWFRPQGSKREGMSSASQPATMRWATGTEKPTCMQEGRYAARECAYRGEGFNHCCHWCSINELVSNGSAALAGSPPVASRSGPDCATEALTTHYG